MEIVIVVLCLVAISFGKETGSDPQTAYRSAPERHSFDSD